MPFPALNYPRFSFTIPVYFVRHVCKYFFTSQLSRCKIDTKYIFCSIPTPSLWLFFSQYQICKLKQFFFFFLEIEGAIIRISWRFFKENLWQKENKKWNPKNKINIIFVFVYSKLYISYAILFSPWIYIVYIYSCDILCFLIFYLFNFICFVIFLFFFIIIYLFIIFFTKIIISAFCVTQL